MTSTAYSHVDHSAALAVQFGAPAGGWHRISTTAKVVNHGIEYCVLYSGAEGTKLRRMDETKAEEFFSTADLTLALKRKVDPMTIDRNFYAPSKTNAATDGARSVAALSEDEQDDILRKEFFIRTFLKKEAEYQEALRIARRNKLPKPPSVSRSEASLKRVLPEIAKEWRDLQIQKLSSRHFTTWKTAAKIEYFEPKHAIFNKWFREYHDSGCDLMSLRDKYRRERPEQFTPDELQFLNNALTEALSTTKPKIAAIYRDMVKKMEDFNRYAGDEDRLRIPCIETLRSRYNDMPDMMQDLGRLGKESARRLWAPEFGGVDVVAPLQRVECDDHETDLQTLLVKIGVWKTLDKNLRKKIRKVRLWISAMICVATRCIVGLHVSSQPPSSKSALTTLEMATRDKTATARRLGCVSPWHHGGSIARLATDSAVYFTGRDFRVSVNDAGSAFFLPPAGEANWRGFIERWFHTFSHQMFSYFTGRTWGSVEEKGDYDSEAHASAVADQVAECMIRWVVDGYHNAKHAGLNDATPANRWLELSRLHGVEPGPTGAIRSHLFGTQFTRTISKKGIFVAGLYYQSRELQIMRRRSRKAVAVGRINNLDIGIVSVKCGEGWIEVPCEHKELCGVSIWQWLAAAERLKIFNRKNAEASRDVMLATFAWLKEQADMARLEAGLVNPVLTSEDYRRFEAKMDRGFKMVDGAVEGQQRPEGEWRPSNELFDALGIQPVVYAKAAADERAEEAAVQREASEQREAHRTRPSRSAKPALEHPDELRTAQADEPAVIQRITNIFGDE